MSIDFKKIATPCYVLEESLLRSNLEILKNVQKESGAKIIFALKGFAMLCTFELVKKSLQGVATSSMNETKLGYKDFGGEIHACSPAYLESDFLELMKYCNYITFNSLSQWERFKPEIKANPKRISCGIRINPEYSEIDTPLYDACIKGSRLGVTSDELGNKFLPDGIEGLHFHSHSENDAATLKNTLEVVKKKFSRLLHQAKWLNMGGGQQITREDYDVGLLIKLIRDISKRYNLKVILEPSQAVSWKTGYLVSTILDIVESNGIKTAILDTSIAAHMPDCIEMPYKPMIFAVGNDYANYPQDKKKNKQPYRMGGLSCLAGDYVGNYYFDNPLETGDIVVFEDMIGYTMVKNTTFNGITLPSIGIWTAADDKFKLIHKFGYEDYRSRLS
ncbi:MAG: carboxynorspermidine decarboxylase [Cytophagales bacterium]|nr:carboxynorspermidine decarboxylase [Cytophagales bacterium]